MGYLQCVCGGGRAGCIDRVYIGEELGDGAVPRQAAVAGEVTVRGCSQQAPPPPSTRWHVQISHLMPVYLAKWMTAAYTPATTQGPTPVSSASTGRRNQPK